MNKVLNESKFIYAINIFSVASLCLLFSQGSHLNTKTNQNFIFSVRLTSASMGIVIFELYIAIFYLLFIRVSFVKIHPVTSS